MLEFTCIYLLDKVACFMSDFLPDWLIEYDLSYAICFISYKYLEHVPSGNFPSLHAVNLSRGFENYG
jgi:hypothetical protein